MNIQTVRLGRSAARHLTSLVANQCLDEVELKRCLGRIRAALDEVVADIDAPPPVTRAGFTLIDGGRP